MIDVMLISEQLLKSRTAINDNVDSNELKYCIITAQNLNIQESLGENLYLKIVNDVATNTISGNYKHLLDKYIVPALIAWSYYYGLDNFFVKWTNAGLMRNSNEQGASPDYRTFQYLKNNSRSTAEFYDESIRRYLCTKSNLFPEYNVVKIEQLQPQRGTAYKSSIAFDADRRLAYWYGPVEDKTKF